MPQSPSSYNRDLDTSYVGTWTSVSTSASWIPQLMLGKTDPPLTGFLIWRYQTIFRCYVTLDVRVSFSGRSSPYPASKSLEKLTRVSTTFGPGLHLKPVLGFFRCFSLLQSSWRDAALHSSSPCHSSEKPWWSATGHTERLKAEAPSQRRFKNVCAQVKDFLMF